MENQRQSPKLMKERIGALIHRMRTLSGQIRSAQSVAEQLKLEFEAANNTVGMASFADASEGCAEAADILDSNATNLHSLTVPKRHPRRAPISAK